MSFATRPHPVMRPLLAALLFSPLAVHAAAAPDSGSILQQINPSGAPTPSSGETGLKVEQGGGAGLPSSAPFEVRTIRISGNTVFDTATLHALVADAEGKRLTLAEVNDLAARITAYYRSHNYPLARAIIPAQTVSDGVLNVQVIEARYDKIDLDNRSRVNDALVRDTLSPLQSGQMIGQRQLDRALLLLSDIPGVGVNATLKPGTAVGTSDLLVETTPGAALAGGVSADNYGNRYTGRARLGGTVDVIDPLRHGDVLTLSALTSGGDMDYARVGYESLLNGMGTRAGASYAAVRYTLGDSLAALDAHGKAEVGSLWAKQPLLRSRNANVYGRLEYDRKNLRDRVDASLIRTDRHLDNGVLSLSGDWRDTFLSGGINTWSLGWTAGRVAFDDADAEANDAATARTRGRFSKWNLTFSRLQTLTASTALYLSFTGQEADGNLDSSEKMTVGGPYTVRAYEMGTVSGDTGYLGTAELRHDIGDVAGGRLLGLLFVDSARVTVNRNTWAAGDNTASLSGAGIGLNWIGRNQWRVQACVAARIGSKPVLAGDASSSRAWIAVARVF